MKSTTSKWPLWVGGVLGALLLFCIANYMAGVLLFLSYKQSPGQAGLFTIQQAYFSYTDPRVLLRVKTLFFMSILMCFGGTFAAYMAARARVTNKTLFGKAHFATTHDIKKEKLDGDKGVVLGKFHDKLLRLGGYEFVLLAAPTRTGKGVGFCVPNLLQFTGSAVVLDIKGENYNLTSEFRRRYLGNEIVYFNPFSENTHRWNPLSYVSDDPNFRANDLMALATIIYPVNEKDPFWSDAAKNLFIGLGLLVLETPELPSTIGEILRQGSGKGMAIEEYLKHVLAQRAASANPLSNNCRDTLNRFLNSGEQALKGVHATFTASLTPWGNAVIDKATSGDDFSLRDVRKKKVTIYLNIPAGEILQAAPIIKLFFSQLINENVKELPEQNPDLKYQCLLMLDEFTAMGKVEIIAKGVGYMAGYNMRLAIIIQDKNQLEAVYGKEDAHNIVSNMGAVIYFTPSQISEAEEYSKMIGNDTVSTSSRQTPKGSLFGVKADGGNPSTTEQYQSRAIMLPQELLQMSKDLELVVRSGMPVIKADKIKYFEDDYFKERFTAVPMHEVTIGSERRKVPIPARLPQGDWARFHEAVRSSDHYVSGVVPAAAPAAPVATPVPEAAAAPKVVEPVRPVPPPLPAAAAALAGQTLPFDELHARLRAGAVAEEAFATVRVAKAYADAIVTYWQQVAEHGDLITGEPLVVLDLFPRDGEFLWKLLLSLQARMAMWDVPLPPVRYIACVEDEAERVTLEAHPYLAESVAHGLFSAVVRNQLLSTPGPLLETNPLAVIAEHYFSSLPHAQLAYRGGSVLSALATVNPGRAVAEAQVPVDLAWPVFQAAEVSPVVQSVLDAYGDGAETVHVRVPLVGCQVLEAVNRVAGHRFLLVAADPAVSQARAIRKGVFAVPDVLGLPLSPRLANHHGLTVAAKALDIEAWTDEGADGAPSLLLLLGKVEGNPPGLLSALANLVAGAPHASGAASTQVLSAGQCLAALRQAEHDPHVLLSLGTSLARIDWEAQALALEPWHRALEAAWVPCFPVAGGHSIHPHVAYLAMQAKHYGLARAASAAGMLVGGDNVQDLTAIALSDMHTGAIASAREAVTRALALDPADATCLALSAELANRERDALAHAWFRPALAVAPSLRLQPLAAHDADAVWRQCGDGAMAEMPQLNAPGDAAAWLEAETRDPNHLVCAVLHEEWGFIGAVGIDSDGDAGLFHFWIGPDHQGKGHGVEAAKCLLAMVKESGIRRVFATVQSGNRRSLSAMASIGFERVDVAALPPDAGLQFFRLGDDPDPKQSLARLCADKAPELRFS